MTSPISVGRSSVKLAVAHTLDEGFPLTRSEDQRRPVRVVLREWGLGHLTDDAVLITSELLTNALQASQALGTFTPIALRLLANDEQLIIEAWDQWVEGYDLKRTPGDDEHGRGLAVIDALSNRWGIGRLSDDYKVVWAELLV